MLLLREKRAILKHMKDSEKDFFHNIDNRFNRIYGQIKALQKNIHVHKDESYKDTIYQIKAARKALKKISDLLIERKIKACVDLEKEEFKDLKEALELLERDY